MAARISLIIPTQRRPGPLALAVRSALAQQGVDPAELELVVVDNDSVPSAKAAVERLATEAPFPLVYVHEPSAGVANARNAAMEQAEGELIAFLDDDEEAPPHWLASLLAVQARWDADVVFGPVRARAPARIVRHRAYLEQFFSRSDPAAEGLIDHYYGCGDSLLRRAALVDPKRPFSPERNRSGGEDDLLFGALQRAGKRFAWAPEAWVWEDPSPERLALAYTLPRAFVYGQGPVAHCAAADPPDWAGILRWMLIGAGQAIVYGLLALILWLLRRPDRAFMMDRAARGLGKVFWGKRFRINFYGRTVSDNAGQDIASDS
ncbi:glycosyltransferase family 2 protein [Phenylobacterium montanum]|uniref:Glycosyltransferase family 2 protein n=1 Tax=Phenylobacterium montanum TaxID=2823693 RepID=A0A975IWB6_9CAUL|nr:glycosyltransferase family 2 protein [Caulobacter sp. S6]QUD89703.1 glycosyltransferase family 2 protein [Caulobacter sp. S6]